MGLKVFLSSNSRGDIDLQCPICLDRPISTSPLVLRMEKVPILPSWVPFSGWLTTCHRVTESCGHFFCEECLNDSRISECPSCRQPFSEKMKAKDFFDTLLEAFKKRKAATLVKEAIKVVSLLNDRDKLDAINRLAQACIQMRSVKSLLQLKERITPSQKYQALAGIGLALVQRGRIEKALKVVIHLSPKPGEYVEELCQDLQDSIRAAVVIHLYGREGAIERISEIYFSMRSFSRDLYFAPWKAYPTFKVACMMLNLKNYEGRQDQLLKMNRMCLFGVQNPRVYFDLPFRDGMSPSQKYQALASVGVAFGQTGRIDDALEVVNKLTPKPRENVEELCQDLKDCIRAAVVKSLYGRNGRKVSIEKISKIYFSMRRLTRNCYFRNWIEWNDFNHSIQSLVSR